MTRADPRRLIGSVADVHGRRTTEDRLQHDAIHDALTGLPNRALLVDRLERLLGRGLRNPDASCALLWLDVDGLNDVNQDVSHAVGDRLLMTLAGRLVGVLRPTDTVARMGGDEFAILLDDVSDVKAAGVVADRLQQSLARPFSIDGRKLSVTASIGVAVTAPDADAATLMRNAEVAMYDAKRRGRARSSVFEEVMSARRIERTDGEAEVREAVEQSRVEVYFQPIVDLATGRITALEALARWPGSPPQLAVRDLILIAEESKLIGELGLHVLRTSLDALADWRARGLVAADVPVSVNVSARQLDDPAVCGHVRAAMAAAGLPGSALRLEVTEATLTREPQRVGEVIAELCSSGTALHVDDFGTGYSSLAALREFPVEALKIDRSLIGAMGDGADGDEAVVRSTIALAHSLDLHVIAEGIEDAVALRRLRRLGCEYGQGYLFAAPMPREDAEVLLTGWSPEAGVAAADRTAPSRAPAE